MSKRKSTLDTFVIKSKKSSLQESAINAPSEHENISGTCTSADQKPEHIPAVAAPEQHPEPVPEPSKFSTLGSELDLGLILSKKEQIFDKDKYELLKHAFKPGIDFVFPCSIHIKNGKEVKCYLSRKHFEKFTWLTFSRSLDGVFCIYCAIFIKFGGKDTGAPLKELVEVPLRKYSKLLGKDGDLSSHHENLYHKKATIYAKNFLDVYENPKKDVRHVLDTERNKLAAENRARLVPIVESIIFLGKQNIPFRGHRDSGILKNASVVNEGNFRELLRFRINSGDNILKHHLETTSSKATYISSVTQNQIIGSCGEEILHQILCKIKSGKYYSVIFDETTDVSHASQMSVVLRYVDKGGDPQESFVGFLDCHATNYDSTTHEPYLSGEVLANTVTKFLKSHDLNPSYCVGIGTDTCNLMLGEQKGAVTELQKYFVNALRCPCKNHALNLSISKCNNVQAVRNSLGTISEVVAFFNASSKRSFVLKSVNEEKLKSLCETRWIDRHQSVIKFKGSLTQIVECLSIISQWRDLDSASKANCLKASILTLTFLVSLHCLTEVLSITINLSKILQLKSISKQYADGLIKGVIDTLKDKRQHATEIFETIFKEVEKNAIELEVPVVLPRLTKSQKNRPNPEVKTCEEYYRITVFIPLLDNIIEDLQMRFGDSNMLIFDFNILIPEVIISADFCEVNQALRNISGYLSKIHNDSEDCNDYIYTSIRGETDLYKTMWQSQELDDIPNSIDSSFKKCDPNIFPFIKKSLQIALTWPSSVATAERSFSSLRRLKTWLRSNMSQDRLVGLALLHVHGWDIDIKTDSVIDRFVNQTNRKVDFVI
ncbi:unnamed protein product [Callosobruchus maculatus]|uniref:TTF-type domain-containing protein n=1 Tax=Callosobruchus maculatus TaxID=64391 RepID=A0A653CS35_CALMS|nr:unnamed protein product [Callosobruchus maculatus]